MTEIVVFDNTYAPKVDYVDKSWDRATGISPGERQRVAKADVVKEEMQSGSAFNKCIKASMTKDELKMER